MASRLTIGLTGGIASGKSTAATRFQERGISVVAADEAAREVVAKGQPGLAEVLARFGPEVRAANGELDRRALRALVFADPASRRDLESILHPLIRHEMERRKELAVGPYVVMDIPLLVEAKSRANVDRILVIDVDEATQLRRLMERDQSTLFEAQAILKAQVGRNERLKAADDVIENSGSIAELRQAVDRMHERYLRLAETHS
jgi:dephospho-CoA kinase